MDRMDMSVGLFGFNPELLNNYCDLHQKKISAFYKVTGPDKKFSNLANIISNDYACSNKHKEIRAFSLHGL